MASFISALALFILVLSNGCFTLPILDEQVFSSTYSSVNDDVTTGETFNLRVNFCFFYFHLNKIIF